MEEVVPVDKNTLVLNRMQPISYMTPLAFYNEIRIGSCVELLIDFAEYLQLSAHQFSCLCFKLRSQGTQIKAIGREPNFSIVSIKQGALISDLGLTDI